MKKLIITLIIILIIVSQKGISQKWEVAQKFGYESCAYYSAYACDSMTYIFPSWHDVLKKGSSIPDSTGIIYYITEDYGETWEPFLSLVKPFDYSTLGKEPINSVEGIQIFNRDSVYIMHCLDTNETYLFKTYDAGKTWDTVKVPIGRQTNNIERNFIHFKNTQEGMVAPYLNYIFLTTDGGETWTESNLPTLNDTITRYAKDKWWLRDSVVTVEFEYSVLKAPKYPFEYYFTRAVLYSSDYGKTWDTFYDHDYDTAFNSTTIECRNLDEYWACSSYDVPGDKVWNRTQIRISKDRGKTWEPLETESEIKGSPVDLYFFDNQIILLSRYSVYRSYDEGKTWIEDDNWDNPYMTSENNHFGIISSSCFATPTNGLLYDGFLDCLYKYTLPPISVNDEIGYSNIRFRPNPVEAGGQLYLDITGNNYDVEIFDFSGRCIQKSNLKLNSFLLRDDIAAGVYFIVVKSQGKFIGREKIIVE